jgi:hypothetical protein
MFALFIRLIITVAQLGLIHFIFTNIQFDEDTKVNEKIALKNYLHGFLIYVIGFSAVMSIVYNFLKFPRRLQMPLFLGGLFLFTLVWVMENKPMIQENMKHTWVGKMLGNQVTIVKETMATNPRVSKVYPWHEYEPNSNIGKISTKQPLFQFDTGAKMILEMK